MHISCLLLFFLVLPAASTFEICVYCHPCRSHPTSFAEFAKMWDVELNQQRIRSFSFTLGWVTCVIRHSMDRQKQNRSCRFSFLTTKASACPFPALRIYVIALAWGHGIRLLRRRRRRKKNEHNNSRIQRKGYLATKLSSRKRRLPIYTEDF